MEASFKDKNGREYSLEMTVGTALKIKREFDIDILHPEREDEKGNTEFYFDLVDNPEKLFAIIGWMAEEQFPDMSYEEFAAAIDGRTLRDAQQAFFDGVQVFFSDSGHPERAQVVIEVQRTIAAAMELATKKVKKIAKEELKNLPEKFEKRFQTDGKPSGK